MNINDVMFELKPVVRNAFRDSRVKELIGYGNEGLQCDACDETFSKEAQAEEHVALEHVCDEELSALEFGIWQTLVWLKDNGKLRDDEKG